MPGRSVTSGEPTREGFTGHEYDGETGWIYAGARYYMPALGRWTSVDPMADEFPAWNPYNYVLNNPLVLVDPTGMAPDPSGDCGNDVACLKGQELGRYLNDLPMTWGGIASAEVGSPRDDYKLDKQGNISLIRETDDPFDVLYATNTDGTVDKSTSIQIDKGVLGNVTRGTGPYGAYDYMSMSGDNKATRLFEFVATNSLVEWSLTRYSSAHAV